MSKYVLLTGATGLVGRYLVRGLLLDDHRVAILIRPTERQNIHERLESLLQPWEHELGRPLPRPVCLQGDVCETGLGLDTGSRRWVARHCDRILHNAAVLTFHGPDRLGEPWRTNLDGTRNLLDFCAETGLRNLHYVSTAYVCGTRPGVILEDELDCGQGFRNDYENSKFFAEKMVRDADCFEQLTVYRPVVIAGDSRTGFTSTYHGLYMYLQLMSVINRNTEPDENGVRHTNLRLNMTGDEPRNVVPVDWISDVMCYLFRTPAAHGRTYHLAPRVTMTARQMIEAGFTYYNSCGVEFSGLPEPVPGPDLNQIERATYENKTMYEAYEASDPVFDTSNLEQFASHLPCPEIDEAMIHRFLQFGEKDRWGRRKAPKPEIPIWVGEMLQAVVDEHVSGSANAVHHSTDCDSVASRSDRVHVVGLDLSGPGGGQWTMKLQGQTVVACEPGISKDDSVLRVPAEDFINLLSGCGKTIARLRGHETSTTGREKAKPLDLVTQIFRSQSTHGNLRRADSIATGSGSR